MKNGGKDMKDTRNRKGKERNKENPCRKGVAEDLNDTEAEEGSLSFRCVVGCVIATTE